MSSPLRFLFKPLPSSQVLAVKVSLASAAGEDDCMALGRGDGWEECVMFSAADPWERLLMGTLTCVLVTEDDA